MELHTCLWNEVAAFDFNDSDFAPLRAAFPHARLVSHRSPDEALRAAHTITTLLTWEFDVSWYERCPLLTTIMTPAAGTDWVAPDPAGRVRLVHGTFHGPILCESLLGAILFMNHRMPDMIRNFEHRRWDRNLQADCRLLRNQTVVIIGLGHIGAECARTLHDFGARVIGIKRQPARLTQSLPGVEVRSLDELDKSLGEADHLILLLPGDKSTNRFLTREHLLRCKRGVYVYNFGRGNALPSDVIAACARHIGGAFLDVLDEEPLPADSPLWKLPNVMITPHSSCIYREYKSAFIDEVISVISKDPLLAGR
jgi:D-2-hydroxyacid dehydrogenase (NADP+)